jgi:hypothetical protein
MGTYCNNNCGQKLIGYMVPTTCACSQRYCSACWRHFFRDTLRFTMRQEQFYMIRRGVNGAPDGYDEFDGDLWEAKPLCAPKCPKCDTPMQEDMVNDDG